MTPVSRPWVHPDVVVGPSPQHGSGLFARAPLAVDVPVVRLAGREIDAVALRELIAAADRGDRPYVDSVTIGPDRHLVLPPGHPAGRGNQSCEPTTVPALLARIRAAAP